MAENAVVSAKITKEIKKETTIVLASIGLTLSDAFRLMLTRVAQDKALPFDPLISNKKTIQAMKETSEATNLQSFDSVYEFMSDLNA